MTPLLNVVTSKSKGIPPSFLAMIILKNNRKHEPKKKRKMCERSYDFEAFLSVDTFRVKEIKLFESLSCVDIFLIHWVQ